MSVPTQSSDTTLNSKSNSGVENPHAVEGLASPAERPNSDIIIFDGQCIFCTGQVKRIQNWDKRGQLAFLSLHDPMTNQVCPDLSHDDLMEQLYLVTKDGERHAGAAAIRYLSRNLPRLWILAPVLHIPFSLPLWQWCYMKVAERRYQISGKSDPCESGTCDLHFNKNK